MKLVQCEKVKMHFYDGSKFSECPHCAKAKAVSEARNDNDMRFGDTFSNDEIPLLDMPAHSEPPKPLVFDEQKPQKHSAEQETPRVEKALSAEDAEAFEKTVAEPLPFSLPSSQKTDPAVMPDVGINGSVSDLKTIALYSFEEDIEPVTGWLVIYTGDSKGKSLTLKSGKNTIGRSGSGTAPDICLDDDLTISRGVQAVLIYDPKNKKFFIQPTDGSSLVYLNDELLMTYSELKLYDKITIGSTELIFVPFCSDVISW